MTERQIIMAAEMVKGIQRPLHPKRQTRRVLRLPRGYEHGEIIEARPVVDGSWTFWTDPGPGFRLRCPYGVPGDRLWVRETWYPSSSYDNELKRDEWYIHYDADGVTRGPFQPPATWKEPLISSERPYVECPVNVSPLLMPRWAARLLLEVVDVRVQRLRDITEAEAAEEGLPPNWLDDLSSWRPEEHGWLTPAGLALARKGRDCDEGGCVGGTPYVFSARDALKAWWDHINRRREGYGWADNPWVWAVSFRPVSP